MNDDWVETTLGMIAVFKSGKNAPQDIRGTNGSFLMLGANGKIGRSTLPLFSGPLITVGRVGAYGQVHRVGAEQVWVSDNALVALPRSDAVSLGYLMHILQSVDYEAIRTGTTQPLITQTALSTVACLVPPLPVQRRIVDLMAHLDNQIANLRLERDAGRAVRVATLSTLLDATREIPADYDAAFDLADLAPQASPTSEQTMNEEWTETTLGEVASFASGYSFPPAEQGHSDGMYPFYKVSDMNRAGNETWMSEAANFVERDAVERLRVRIWPCGTVIFPKVGAALLTEKRRILSRPGIFDNNVMGLVAGDDILPEFLLAFMQITALGEFAQQGAVPSVNQSHISVIPISLPPLPVQRRIVDLMAHLDNQIAGMDVEVSTLESLRRQLLVSLLSQGVELPASYDLLFDGMV